MKRRLTPAGKFWLSYAALLAAGALWLVLR